MIAKEKEAEVLRLYHGEKWPVGTIAAQLGLHHTTVQRVLGQSGVDPKVVAPRPSMVDPSCPSSSSSSASIPRGARVASSACLRSAAIRAVPILCAG